MRIKHDLVISNGNIIPYIYIELVDDVEFSKEFWNGDDEKSFVSKLTRYIKTFFNNLNSDTAVLIINGIMIGTMSISMLLNSYNKNVSKNTCNMLSNNQIFTVTESNQEEKEISIDILQKVDEEEKKILNKNVSTYVLNDENSTKTQQENVNADVSNNKMEVNSKENIEISSKTENDSIVDTNVQKLEQPKQEEVEVPKQDETINTPVIEQGQNIQLSTGGNVITINLEEYILGVVGAEMPASFNTEALKAQAIAARTYAMKKTASGKILQDSVSDQVYETENELRNKWGSSFDYYYNKIKDAVNSTKGMVMMYGGDYIDALYHSISNGKTELPKYIWNSNYPYLISVDSSWDKNVKNYEVTKTYDYATVTQKLGVNVNKDTAIDILSYTESGRVNQINIGEKTLSGVDVRTKLGLRSTDFTITKNDLGISITTKGYGHGVGMSQYGANEMAKQGYSYMQILTHYYTGINIVYI